MTDTDLQPVACHITANATDGTSSFEQPEEPKIQLLGHGMQMTYLYSSPAGLSIAEGTDMAYHRAAPSSPPLRSFPPAGATAVVALDLAPNPNDEPGHMHRTQTLDYVIVLEGEMELALDGGETRICRKGDVVVQRAPMHTWKNVSKTESARMLAVAIGSQGAVEGGMEFLG